MDFSVLADRDCLVAVAAVVLCSDRGVQPHNMGYDYGGIAHLTAKGAAGRTGLSQAASGQALRRVEEAGLIIAGGGDHDADAGTLRHHLQAAGRTADLFSQDAVTQIHQAARGKPRTVNNLCIAALIATAGAGNALVDHSAARAAIAEVTATD